MYPGQTEQRLSVFNVEIMFLILLVSIIINNNNIEWITVMADTGTQVIPANKQEIERFKVIQEQIQHHQKLEQNELEMKRKITDNEMEKNGQESQIQPQFPAESFLIPEPPIIPMYFQLQKTPIPPESPIPLPYNNHRVSMPPLISSPIMTFGTKTIPAHLSSHHYYPPTQPIQAAIWTQINKNNPFYDGKIKLINQQPTSVQYRINKQESKQEFFDGRKDFNGKTDKQTDLGIILNYFKFYI